MRSRRVVRLVRTFGLASCVVAAACDRPPASDSVPEWSPKDHHSQDDDKLSGRAPPATQGSRGPRAGGGGDVTQLVELTWRQQCTNCHGAAGKGDGPMGAMVNAPDLTRGAWQQSASDADIAGIIRGGRNRMPKYDLPDSVIQGLVARVRTLRGP